MIHKLLGLLVCFLWLSGCGQTGPLYLPTEKPSAQRPSVEKPATKTTVKHTEISK